MMTENTIPFYTKLNLNWKPVGIKLITAYLFFIIPLSIIRPEENVRASFLLVSFLCILSSLVLCKMLIPQLGRFAMVTIGLSFSLKWIIGLWHFLTFIQPNYFKGDISYEFFNDYVWMHDSLEYLAELKRENGFFTPIPSSFFIENKNSFLYIFASDLYYFGGNFVLNIAPYNIMMSLFTSVLLTLIGASFLKLSKNQTQVLLLLLAFFPFSFLPDMTTRDIIGQFLMTIGMLFLVNFEIDKRKFLLLFLSALFFYFQRKFYVVIPFVAYILSNYSMIGEKDKNTSRNKIINSIVLAIGIFLYLFSNNLLASAANTINIDLAETSESYAAGFSKIKFYLSFPAYIVKGFIGPFPWVQFFTYAEETIGQPSDYLDSVFMSSIIILIAPVLYKLVTKGIGIDIVTISGILVILSGISSGFIHSVYLAIGFIFVLPLAAKYNTSVQLTNMFSKVFFFFICLNLFWVLFGFYGKDSFGIFRI